MRKGVLGIIRKEDKLLLGVEGRDAHPCKGQWRLLGGRLEEGESPVVALERELQEEAGISLAIRTHLCTTKGAYAKDMEISIYLADWAAGNPVPLNDEVAEFGWFTIPDINKLSNMDELSKDMINLNADKI